MIGSSRGWRGYVELSCVVLPCVAWIWRAVRGLGVAKERVDRAPIGIGYSMSGTATARRWWEPQTSIRRGTMPPGGMLVSFR